MYLNDEDTEKANIYEAYVIKCAELLKEKETDHNVIITAVKMYQYLGQVSLKRNKSEAAVVVLR